MESKVESFLTAAEEQEVVDQIRQAELKTSGEIRVHLEHHCNGDAYKRAQDLFHALKMDNTKQANGILIYLAVSDRKFSILGDHGIDAVVPNNFWNSTRDGMEACFRKSKFKEGLLYGIHSVGEKLAHYFPWDQDDTNELPNEITTS